MLRKVYGFALLVFLTVPSVGRAFEIRTLPIGATTATVVSVNVYENLNLFLDATNGTPYRNFDLLRQEVETEYSELLFAINAGPYHPDGHPVGLYIKDGRKRYSLNENSGDGNFFMKPNGVFYRDAHGFSITNTKMFKHQKIAVELATQSGPLLLQDGLINPAFKNNSKNKYVRNAVCLKDNKTAHFFITNGPVNFYTLADFAKESLGCSNALYLDGFVSSLYLPKIGRHDRQKYASGEPVKLGPILAITTCRHDDGTEPCGTAVPPASFSSPQRGN